MTAETESSGVKKKPETLYIHHSPHETRVALQQGREVVELQVERTAGRGLSGNVYRGRVVRVIASMDAAFVDIGLDRMALLHAADVWQAGAAPVPQPSDETGDGEPPKRKAHKTITQLLQPGQQVMVQVVREPVAKKGPRVTTYVSLPGRNVVLLTREPHCGVSKMIADVAERVRLQQIVHNLMPPGCGAIVRTVGEGATEAELAEDVRLLREQWEDIQARFSAASGPSFIFDDLDLVLRSLRDMVGAHTQTVWIDDPGEVTRVERFCKRFHPEARPQVRLHEASTSLFELHGLDRWVREAVEPRVRLQSGGELVVSRTEAMTVIDVNSSRQVGGESLGDALLALNLEAARAIAAQLRLRNIGGLVIVDFVDMQRVDDRRKLEVAFEAELARDRARVRLGKISEFGTIQLTRKRVRESIYERVTETCATCKGRGYVRSASDLAIETLERLRTALQNAEGRTPAVAVQVPTRVAAILKDQLSGAIRDLERLYHVQLEIVDDARLNQGFQSTPASGTLARVSEEAPRGQWRLGRALGEVASDHEG
jgi:ribonuclease G